MARNRRRATTAIANRPVDVYPDSLPLSELQNGRLWSPNPFPTSWPDPLRLNSAKARLVIGQNVNRPFKPSRPFATLSPVVRFEAPKKVLVCIRRKQRREVLHAKGIAGRRGLRMPRRSPYSSVSCR